jgi:hypothetical protein
MSGTILVKVVLLPDSMRHFFQSRLTQNAVVLNGYASTELVRERFDKWLDITHIELVICEPS